MKNCILFQYLCGAVGDASPHCAGLARESTEQ
jgi:hypothetical protein